MKRYDTEVLVYPNDSHNDDCGGGGDHNSHGPKRTPRPAGRNAKENDNAPLRRKR